jgi:hypothetical protein
MAAKKTATKSTEKQSNDPCWKGYKKDGMKVKNEKKVPNCVPAKRA